MSKKNENKITAQELLNRIGTANNDSDKELAAESAENDAAAPGISAEPSLVDEDVFTQVLEQENDTDSSANELPEDIADEIDEYREVMIAESSDVFDNDPIMDETDEIPAEPEPEEKVTPEEDFETLVSEVTGNATDELDETDLGLMVALGMEDELAKNVGAEHAAKITDEFVANQEEWIDRTERYGAGEYTGIEQNAEIAARYAKKNKFLLLRFLLALALAVIVLCYENLPLVGYQPGGVLDPAVYPFIYIMADLQLIMFMAALAFPSLVAGIKGIFTLKPVPQSIAVAVFAVTVAADIYAVATINVGAEPRLYSLSCALCLLMCVLGEYMTNRREIFSFNIVSSKRPKYVMRRLSTRDAQLENQAVSDLEDYSSDESGDIVKIAKTDFVDGYFWRTNTISTTDRPFITLALCLSVLLSVIIGVYAWLSGGISPVSAGLTAFTAVLPASALVIGFYPFYRANRHAYDNDSTIIGEVSVEEYSDTEVISFDDVNVFPSINVKVRSVRLFNNCRIDKVLYYAASVFSATGGPLADVFEVATMELEHSDDVQIIETDTGYIEATVNGKSIMFGRAGALARHGVAIPESVSGEATELSPDCSVMYMIYQKRLVAKMIVSYIIDADFEYILRQLTASGMYVCVKTFDPNIDEDMINAQVKDEKYPLRVIKYKGTEEITKYSEHTEGGIVSRGTTKALLQTIAVCDRIVGAKKAGYVLGIVSTVLSVVVMSFIMICGKMDTVYSLYMAANQLFWMIPTLLISRFMIN